jgi:hypothetical protein
VLSSVFALALAGCATASRPDAELAAARSAVIQAEPSAWRYAPAELRLAQGKLARAEQAMALEQWPEARRLAEQAEVDARLAASIADNERSRAAQ